MTLKVQGNLPTRLVGIDIRTNDISFSTPTSVGNFIRLTNVFFSLTWRPGPLMNEAGKKGCDFYCHMDIRTVQNKMYLYNVEMYITCIYIQLHTSFQRSQKSDILKIDSGPKKKQLKNSKSFCKSQGEEFREPRGSTPKKNSMQRVPLPSFGNGYISHLGQKENHLQN